MMDNEGNWYNFEGAEQLDTPCLAIYPDRVVRNIDMIKQMILSPELLRPHVKTNKSADVTRLMIEAGITKFKCATVAEAEMLGISQAKDALLAYQPSRAKLKSFIDVIKRYPGTQFSCLVDNIEVGNMISEQALDSGIVIPVYIDLNVGMNRTGVKPEHAFKLLSQIALLSGLKFLGFHAYDGHIREQNLDARAARCESEFAAVETLRNSIEEQLNYFPLLIAGGSPTFNLHSNRRNVECSPGTFIFWDKGYHDTIPEQNFLFAAVIICKVVSLPDEGKLCIDLGYKSISSESDLQNRVWFLNARELKPVSHSEEHMVVDAGKDHTYKIGDLLYALPVHICPTVAMYDKMYTVNKGTLGSIWPITSRGREIIVHSTETCQ